MGSSAPLRPWRLTDLRCYWNPGRFPIEKEFLVPYDVSVGAALCHLVGFEAGRLPGPPGPKVGSVSLRFFCALQAAAKAAPKARPVSTCFIRALQAAAKKEAVPHDGGVKARSDVDLDPWLHALHANV